MHAYTDYKKGLSQPQEISAEESTKRFGKLVMLG